ncbi:MAG: cytochrome c [Rubrivivax sp.]|nr:MAG: cytochrome c [Rubrivivax sp.]
MSAAFSPFAASPSTEGGRIGWRTRHRLRAVAWLALGSGLAACQPVPPASSHPNQRFTQVDNGDIDRGQRLLAQYQCGSCHGIPEVLASGGQWGPTLEKFGRRSYIAGRVPNGPDTLQRWLQDPQSLIPGTSMPDLGVPAADARDMAAYLLSLE